jgi:diguanylate cyclase
MRPKKNHLALMQAAPEDSQEVLDVVSNAIEGHEKWLQRWTHAIICGTAPPREIVSDQAQYLGPFGSWLATHKGDALVDQPVFRELGEAHADMHAFGRYLALRAADGRAITPEEYDAFIGKVNAFNRHARRIRDAFQQAASVLDPLTGVHNRQTMMRDLERERALRTKSPLCIVLSDIDHFKQVNDSHGHAAGDTVLQAVAGRFLAFLRPYDSMYRYGGEEFLICLPNADIDTAETVIERLRQALAAEPVAADGGLKIAVTASFGVRMVEPGTNLKQTIEQADRALYAAKQGGRNRAVVWTPDLASDGGA